MAEIVLEGVNKVFADGTEAVHDLDLVIPDGQFVVLVGPSGCGKTTVLRMVAGLEDATSGNIGIGGKLVNDVPPGERDVAMVFQNYALYPHMTVYKNIALSLRIRKFKKAEMKRRVDEAARVLHLEGVMDKRPREQDAKLLELRALSSLVRVRGRSGMRDSHYDALRALVSEFPEPHETPDLEDARAQLSLP